ncbi:MAG: thioredoxin family protein [Armatimonadetes bacterium]|nr:thioredoxin family protein [Armatimonadota bacterium]
MKKNLNKLIIVSILIVVIVFVIVLKNRTEKSDVIEDKEVVVDSIATFQQKPDETFEDETIEIQEPEDIVPEQVEKPIEKPGIPETKKQKKAENDIIALVNYSQITETYFNERYNSLPEQYKDMFKNDKEGFLDQMIIKELLFLKAKEKGYDENLTESDEDKLKDKAIEKLVMDISSAIEITDKEMINFYNERESDMKGASFEQVKSDIRNYLVQQKQSEVMDQYIEELKSGAEIVLNEEWIKIQQKSKPKNPLTEAFNTGKPTVLDIGASSCIPCKMMKPIFEELEKEYEGKANILLLEISDYRDIANKYKVRVIPTQIFFDKNGNQYWRHEGFLSKEDIIEKLNELGA